MISYVNNHLVPDSPFQWGEDNIDFHMQSHVRPDNDGHGKFSIIVALPNISKDISKVRYLRQGQTMKEVWKNRLNLFQP